LTEIGLCNRHTSQRGAKEIAASKIDAKAAWISHRKNCRLSASCLVELFY
jgi:hypothetical protein